MRKLALIIAAVVALGIVVLPFEVSAAPKEGHYREPARVVKYPRVGHRAKTLPKAHRTVVVNHTRYLYHYGSFYRPYRQGGYVVVGAPLGARVHSLAPGYISFFIGPRRYFYVNFTYYLWDRNAREYVVVEEPEGAVAAVVSASETSSGNIYVYPKLGQSEEQRERDRYDCYLWATDQTGFDPSAETPDMSKESDYRRAISACLEGRGYTVK